MSLRLSCFPWGRVASLLVLLLSALVAPAGLHAQQEEDEDEDLSAITPRPPAVPPSSVPPGSGPVVATPGMSFDKGSVHRFFFGDLNRDLWDIPFEVEVLGLDTIGGGLTPSELSGGKQTLGLRLRGENGRIYQFRSIIKDATRGIPGMLRIDPLASIVQDQSSAQFPLGAMVVAELLQAADVLVAVPRPIIMPDDPRLGEYRELFAGRMGWIEERPNELEGDRPAFAGSSKITGTEALYENLEEDPRNYVDVRAFLRARLTDMFVGDWDRHYDQWRWASFEDGDLVRWDPIPRDRDWAFSRIDGLIPAWAGMYYPQYRGFSGEYHDPLNYHFSAQFIDRRFLPQLTREDFVATAEALQRTFDDATIDRAVDVLPPGYREAGDQLRRELRERRDGLVDLADDYYELLARWVDITATDASDVAVVTGLPDGFVRVEVVARHEGKEIPKFDRTFDPDETDELRIYMKGGDDEVRVEGEQIDDIRLRLVGNKGDDRFVDATSGKNVKVYDDDGDNQFDIGPRGSVDESEYDSPDGMQHLALIWETRDWGNAWTILPRFSYDTGLGGYIGVTIDRYGFGFRHDPYRTLLRLQAEFGPALDRSRGTFRVMRTLNDHGLQAGLDIGWITGPSTRFFGIGNDTNGDADDDFFIADRDIVQIGLRLASHPDRPFVAYAGPAVVLAEAVEPDGTIFDSLPPVFGASEFNQAGAVAGLLLRNVDNPAFPTSGGSVSVDGRIFPALLDVESVFGSGAIEASYTVAAPDAPLAPAIQLRAGGQKVWGPAPFHELAYLGDAGSLAGYRTHRFAGEEAVSGSALARIKLFQFSPLGALDVGVHGVATSGRVWVDGEQSDTWHRGFGGGIWLLPPSFGRPLSFTAVHGDDETRYYVRLGFLF